MSGQGSAAGGERLPGGRFLRLAALLTLVLCVAIAFDIMPWLRGPSGQHEWRWGYRAFSLRPLRSLAAAAMAALLGGWYWLAQRRERVGGWLLAVLLPLGLAFQLSVLATGPKGLELVARVLNPSYFGYYGPATQVSDVAAYIDTYADEQPGFAHPRLQTHPPGNVVFEWLVLRAVKAVPALTDLAAPYVRPRLGSLPGWIEDYDLTEVVGGIVMSLVIPATTVLAAVPLFRLARAGFGEETARRTVLLYLLTPSITLFEPKIDEVYPLLSSAVFLLTYLGAQGDRLLLVYLSGLVCSVGLFMTYGLLPLIAIAGLFLVGMGVADRRGGREGVLRRLAVQVAVFGAGVATVHAVVVLVFDYEPLRSFFAMLRLTRKVNVGRNYWYSLLYTPWDILLFAGVPAAALLAGRVGRTARAMREGLAAVDWLLVATLAVLALAMLTGVERSENARTYIYLVPVIALFAAAESERLGMGWRAFVALAGLTFVQLMVFQATLEVFL